MSALNATSIVGSRTIAPLSDHPNPQNMAAPVARSAVVNRHPSTSNLPQTKARQAPMRLCALPKKSQTGTLPQTNPRQTHFPRGAGL